VSCWLKPILVEKDLQVNDLSRQKSNFWAMTPLDSNLGYEIANVFPAVKQQWGSLLHPREY
jgi:hypothetical protein